MRKTWAVASLLFVTSSLQAAPLADFPMAFGAREAVQAVTLSPLGDRIAYLAPGPGQATLLYVVDLADDVPKLVTSTDGNPTRFIRCDWVAEDRLACLLQGVARNIERADIVGFSRLIAVDIDGKNLRILGQHNSDKMVGLNQYSGEVIDYLDQNGAVLMMREYVPENTIGTHLAQTREGLGVDRVDTRTGTSSLLLSPRPFASDYMTDGTGKVRIFEAQRIRSSTGQLPGKVEYFYNYAGHDWTHFSDYDEQSREGMVPLAVDPALNAAYALQRRDGRDALYRVALDGSLKTDLVYANPEVDVDELVTLGKQGHVIGFSYATDKREIVYIDPDYQKLGQSLSKALPGLPLIRFLDASRDNQKLLLFAGSDVDPGRYYLLDRATHRMKELMLERPELDGVALAPVKPVTYTAGDGTQVPAYLTLPPGSDGRNLPALVMPHGGPDARDEWGFDWLAQYFAHQGFAVLQPNFRGSSGYGADWFVINGFQSWRTAIGDVAAAGRWLVAQHVADPGKLAIFGWSYGGYAALQANIVDPDLFKAVVAVAPVTDLNMLKAESFYFTYHRLSEDFIGSGPEVIAGSPAKHADAFKAPVLMFHGDLDSNVRVSESRAMDAALKHAGKPSELIVYPGLDHQLRDAQARADMLRRSDAFLRNALHM